MASHYIIQIGGWYYEDARFCYCYCSLQQQHPFPCVYLLLKMCASHEDPSNVGSHLSKSQSDLKQKCTQLPTSFLGTVFNALAQDVIHFVRSVSFKNLKLEVSDWLLKNFNQ